MQIAVARAAQQDLRDIVDYIATDNPSAAANVYQKIMAATLRLTDFPALGRSGWLRGTRELVVPGLPYLVIYQADSDTVTVLAVFHSARDLVRALAERGKPKEG